MTNTSVQEFWDNSGFVDAMIDQAEVWYNKLLGWGVDLKAIPN
jgi:predicted membrane protein